MLMKKIIALLSLISFVANAFSQNLSNTLLFHEAADSVTIFNTYVTKQTTTTYGITPTKCYAYNGAQSAKFELRDTDEMNNSGTRAEITFPTAANLNRWYSFAVLFPCMDWDRDNDDEVINQWHQGGGLTPALCIRTMRDSIYLRIVQDPGGDDEWINLGAIIKNVWHPYVIHVVHSSTSSGLIQIWRNGVLIFTRSGKNMYPVGVGGTTNPNWKLGIYKSGWNDAGTTDVSRRVILFDDIKMGNENSKYREMAPNPNF